VLGYHLLAVVPVMGEDVSDGGGSPTYCRDCGRFRDGR